MRKWLALNFGALALFVSALAATAQLSSTGAGKKASPAAAYSGPGDIVSSASLWVGMRAYSTADRGNKLLNVCNVSDVACGDLSSDATTGALVIGTIGGSSCSIITCTIKTMYDRSGNGRDLTQATIANRPTLTVSCINSLPCAVFVAASDQFVSGASFTQAQPTTNNAVAIRTGNTSAFNAIIGRMTAVGNSPTTFFGNTSNQIAGFAGTVCNATPASENNWHSLTNVLNGASSVININNATISTVNCNTAGWSANTPTVGSAAASPNQSLEGKIVEAGIWPVAFNSTQQTNMCHNQYTYWGTSVSC